MDLTWIALSLSALLSIAIYSFLYKENLGFRVAEHVLIGSFTGHTLVMAFKNIREVGIDGLIQGDLRFIVPLLLGLLLFIRYVPSMAWIIRYPLAVIVGVTAGIEARARFQGWIWKQVTETIQLPLNELINIIIILSMLAVMSYFTFTIKHTGAVGQWARLGRMILLLTFGLTISMDLISRLGSVTARFDWLISETPVATIIGVILFGAYVAYDMRKNTT